MLRGSSLIFLRVSRFSSRNASKSIDRSSFSLKFNADLQKLIKTRRQNEALDIFRQQAQICTDETILMILKMVMNLRDRRIAANIHQLLPNDLLDHSRIQCALIDCYMNSNDVEAAEQFFSTIQKKNGFVYASMFKGYLSNGFHEKVIKSFCKLSVKPDAVLYVLFFNACAKLGNKSAIEIGNQVLRQLPGSFRQHSNLITAAIDMLMKFRQVEDAENLFQSLRRKDVVTFGAMMKGYVINQLPERTLDLFEQIKHESNQVLYAIVFNACASLVNERAIRLGNHLLKQMPKTFHDHLVLVGSTLNMLMKFGQVTDAEDLFRSLKKKDCSTFGTMMNGYNMHEQPNKTLMLFDKVIHQTFVINDSIFVAAINAAAQIGLRSICDKIVKLIPDRARENPLVINALVDMWGKAGEVVRAQDIFKSISQPDTVAYNSMINVYGRNGMGLEAIDLYDRMPEHLRDEISHVCVLNACSHSGFIQQAQTIFDRITKKTEHIFVTMVDCLGRIFLFDQALKLLNDYEKSNVPSSVMYMTLLSAARNHRNLVLAESLFDKMNRLFPDQKHRLISASILLSNTYSSTGNIQRAEQIRADRLKRLGNKIKVGLCWTEVDGKLAQFKAHDHSHPRSAEIYAELERISVELKENGHQYDSSWITRPLEQNETSESILCGHSEKLAIAFNFVVNPKTSFIQITKNLRVCGDCHNATKLIAKLRLCEIVVRDIHRVHHFHPNGQCSCQDHF